MRKPIFRIFDQVRNKWDCTTTDDGYRIEIKDLRRRGMTISMQQYLKVLISCTVTVQHICAYAFENKKRFSHDVAQLLSEDITCSHKMIEITNNEGEILAF